MIYILVYRDPKTGAKINVCGGEFNSAAEAYRAMQPNALAKFRAVVGGDVWHADCFFDQDQAIITLRHRGLTHWCYIEQLRGVNSYGKC